MVICNFVSMVFFVAMTVYSAYTVSAPQRVLLIEGGISPELALLPKMRWHVFLSHVWSSGQDQVATIKRQLQLLLPGISAFLDVDNLDDASQIERHVAESQTFLVFLSKGYFFNKNCMRELDQALDLDIPLMCAVHPETCARLLPSVQCT